MSGTKLGVPVPDPDAVLAQAREDFRGNLRDSATLAVKRARQIAASVREAGLDYQANALEELARTLASAVTAELSPTARIHLEDE